MTHHSPENGSDKSALPWYVWIGGAILGLAILISFVVITVTGQDTAPFVDFLTGRLVNAIGAVIGLMAYVKVRKVQHQTNGTTTALTEELFATRAALARSIPATAVVVPAQVVPDPPAAL